MDQRARRGGDLASVRSRRSSPPSGRPVLGLDLAGGVSVVYTAEGQQRLAGGPRRDRQHLEPARQRARRVRRPGPDVGQEPDLGVHSRRDRRAAGARTRSGRRRACTSARSSASGLPPGRAEGLEGEGCSPTGVETIPACTSSSELTAANLNVNTTTGQATNNVPPDRQYARPTRRRASTSPATPPAPCCCPASAARATGQSGLRCVLGPAPDDRPLHRQRPGHAEPDRRSGWSTTRWPARPARPCGTRWRRRTSTSSSGSSSTGRCTRRPSSSRRQATLHVLRRQGRDLGEPDAGGRAEPGAGHELRCAARRAEGGDVGDGLGHAGALRAGGGPRRRHRRTGPRAPLRPASITAVSGWSSSRAWC